ncbi:MAG: DNA polymerase Y family protein, partial [Nannocystaceae bacterium]
HNLGGFLRLPASEVAARFGRAAAALHATFSGSAWAPLDPKMPEPPLAVSLELDPPDDHRQRLLFLAKGALHALMAQVVARAQKLESLEIRFELDHLSRDETVTTTIEPAEPTCDVLQVLDLLRLRLDQTELPAAVAHLHLEAVAAPVDAAQVGLLDVQPKRDPAAAGRALARLRALFGESAVTHATLTPAHLPEASFAWQPTAEVTPPKVAEHPANNPYDRGLPLVREVFPKPIALPPRPAPEEGLWRHPPSTNPNDKRPYVAIRRLIGPFEISGGWWVRAVARSYYYAQTSSGELRWIYYDNQRERWFWHGRVD